MKASVIHPHQSTPIKSQRILKTQHCEQLENADIATVQILKKELDGLRITYRKVKTETGELVNKKKEIKKTLKKEAAQIELKICQQEEKYSQELEQKKQEYDIAYKEFERLKKIEQKAAVLPCNEKLHSLTQSCTEISNLINEHCKSYKAEIESIKEESMNTLGKYSKDNQMNSLCQMKDQLQNTLNALFQNSTIVELPLKTKCSIAESYFFESI